MTDPDIQHTLHALLNEQISQNDKHFYAGLICFLLVNWLVMYAIAPFIKSFFSTKSITDNAMRREIGEVLSQQSAQAKVLETIRAQTSRSDNSAREWMTLRRLKLEELLTNINDLESWVDRQRASLASPNLKSIIESPISKIEMLANLYFPELMTDITNLTDAAREYATCILEIIQELKAAKNDKEKAALYHGVKDRLHPHYEAMQKSAILISDKAPKLLTTFMGSETVVK